MSIPLISIASINVLNVYIIVESCRSEGHAWTKCMDSSAFALNCMFCTVHVARAKQSEFA